MLEFISGTIAAILLVIGVLSTTKGTLGGYAKAITGILPFGNAKLWGIIFITAGLIAGGATVLWSGASNVISGASVGGLGNANPSVSAQSAMIGTCTLSTISYTTAAQGGGITFSADANDLTHETIIVPTSNSSASINGTLSCPSLRSDYRQGVVANCQVQSDSFRSDVSTTDSNTYYILATSTIASKISGYKWAQTAYLNDGSVATTTSDQEATQLVYAQDVAKRSLGFYMTLPGSDFAKRNNQTSSDVKIVCDDSQEFRFTITKTV